MQLLPYKVYYQSRTGDLDAGDKTNTIHRLHPIDVIFVRIVEIGKNVEVIDQSHAIIPRLSGNRKATLRLAEMVPLPTIAQECPDGRHLRHCFDAHSCVRFAFQESCGHNCGHYVDSSDEISRTIHPR